MCPFLAIRSVPYPKGGCRCVRGRCYSLLSCWSRCSRSQSPRRPPTSSRASPAGDWPAFGRDPGVHRYSPLDQIDRGNFGKLEVAWQWESISKQVTEANPTVRAGEFKVVPIMAGGLLYVGTEVSQVAAIDPGTGKTVWSYDPESWKDGRPANVGFQHRGVSYWTDGKEGPGLHRHARPPTDRARRQDRQADRRASAPAARSTSCPTTVSTSSVAK